MKRSLILVVLHLFIGSGVSGLDAGDESPPTIAPGNPVWRGFIDGLDERPEELLFELAPDGRSFLYFQGLPWPRLMIQPLDPPGQEAIMLGTSAPLSDYGARFSRTGATVFFTAELDWQSGRPRPPGEPQKNRAISAAVLGINVAGTGEKKLAPRTQQQGKDSAILLDINSRDDTLLIGTTANLRLFDLPGGNFSLNLEEMTPNREGGNALGISIKGRSYVRYSSDGRFIYYTAKNRWEDGISVMRYERSTGLHARVAVDIGRCGWRAGDLEVGHTLLPHPGSFGRDAFPVYLLRSSIDAAPVALRLAADFPAAARGAVRPHTVRGNLILLSGGWRDRLELIVAPWSTADFSREARRAARARSLDPEWPTTGSLISRDRAASVLRATATGEASSILAAMKRSLLLLPGSPVEAVRAVWKHQVTDVGQTMESRLVVVESAGGSIHIEKITPSKNPDDPPRREFLVSNGQTSRIIGAGGESRIISRPALIEELNMRSPYQLLLDPAGLGHLGLHFQMLPGDEKEAAERMLSFRHIDGHYGMLHVKTTAGRPLPVRLRTPLLFPALKIRRGFGNVPEEKQVFFEDYQPRSGRLIPHRIRFDNGIEPFTLILEELDFNPPIRDDLFEVGG